MRNLYLEAGIKSAQTRFRAYKLSYSQKGCQKREIVANFAKKDFPLFIEQVSPHFTNRNELLREFILFGVFENTNETPFWKMAIAEEDLERFAVKKYVIMNAKYNIIDPYIRLEFFKGAGRIKKKIQIEKFNKDVQQQQDIDLILQQDFALFITHLAPHFNNTLEIYNEILDVSLDHKEGDETPHGKDKSVSHKNAFETYSDIIKWILRESHHKLLVIDIETTGSNSSVDLIVEAGCALLDIQTLDLEPLYSKIVNENPTSLRDDAWIFGHSDLTPEMIRNEQVSDGWKTELQNLFDLYPAVAYNQTFDFSWLESRGLRIPEKGGDPMPIIAKMMALPHPIYGCRNPTVQEALSFLGLDVQETNRAESDAIAEGGIIGALIQKGEYPIST